MLNSRKSSVRSYFTSDSYKAEYLKTPHWNNLRDQLIYSNSGAQCWICGKMYSLLLHHEKYDNLYHERLGYDIVILCFDCHSQVHFQKILYFFPRKTKLKFRSLKKRRYFLKSISVTRRKQFFLTLWYFMLYLLM